MKEALRRYVQGDLAEPLRTTSVDDFKRLALSMRDETITVRARDVIRVLQASLHGQVGMTDLADWTTLVFYGVHPLMIQHREWGTADNLELLHKGISDSEGVKKVHIRYDEKCDDIISEVMNELEDLGDVRSEVTREEIETWMEKLSECDSGTN